MLKSPQPAQLAYGIAPPVFRLPAATHVGAVALQVSDLQQSVEFYERVLGLRLYRTEAEAAALGPHREAHALVNLHTRRGVTRTRRGAFGLFHFAIVLPDRAALGRFARHLSASRLRFAMADHMVSESLYLWDPDGLGIEVYADRPRATWQRRERELVMTTDPLDIAGLIAAAGGAEWQGLPAGTTMGHVHLNVGSLEEAEAFYHRVLGFDKTVWTYPGALFMSAGGYHHHVAANIWSPGPAPSADDARLLEWELLVPTAGDVAALARGLRAAACLAEITIDGVASADPWGTRVRVRAEEQVSERVH